MSDRYEAEEAGVRYWTVQDRHHGHSVASYSGQGAEGSASEAASELNLNPWLWQEPEELPEAERTAPDAQSPSPPYYFRVDFIGGHFEAVCSLCENSVLTIEHRMSVTTPVTVSAAHVCPPAPGGRL